MVSQHEDPTSSEERRAVALAAIAAAKPDARLDDLPADLQRICRGAVVGLGVEGSSIQVNARDGVGAVLASSDAAAHAIGDAEFATGEGPGHDAFALARPVLISRLLEDGQVRWPGFVAAVRSSGVRACFSLPLHVGAVRLGVLDLYRWHPGELQPTEVSLALTFADLATERLLDPRPDPSGGLEARLLDAMDRNSEIHQAQGMVMVDLGVDLAEAMALMRAHAFSRDLSLLDVARELLAGERLPPLEGPGADRTS
jgi:hypothetical protein